MVDQVVRTGRPMLITRRGRGVAVLVDVGQFERGQEALAFGQAVDEGAAQAERGESATDAEVEAVLGHRAKSIVARAIRWTRLALADLVAIRKHVAADHPLAADARVVEVRAAVERLIECPLSGRIVPERQAQGHREIVVAPCR